MTDSNQFFSIDERIQDLRSRGLLIHDEAVAREELERIGQYRLKRYWYSFFDKSIPGRGIFRPGHSFEDILTLYAMDRELRGLLLRPLEALELNLRSSLSQVLHREGKAFGIYENGFLKDFKGKSRGRMIHEKVLKHRENYSFLRIHENQAYPELELMDETQREIFIRDKVQYPIWLIVEAVSFSDLAKIFDGLTDKNLRIAITNRFEDWDEYALNLFVKRASVLRNAVAHHARVWNMQQIFGGRLPWFMQPHYPMKSSFKEYNSKTMFDILTLFLDLTPKLEKDDYWWNYEVHEFVNRQPKWVLQEMGFPGNWHTFSHWKPLELSYTE